MIPFYFVWLYSYDLYEFHMITSVPLAKVKKLTHTHIYNMYYINVRDTLR